MSILSDPMGYWVDYGYLEADVECPACEECAASEVRNKRGKCRGATGYWVWYECGECGHRWKDFDRDYWSEYTA